MILNGLRSALTGLRVVEWAALSREATHAGRGPTTRAGLESALWRWLAS